MNRVMALLRKKPYNFYIVAGCNFEDEVIRIIKEYTAMKLEKAGYTMEQLLKAMDVKSDEL